MTADSPITVTTTGRSILQPKAVPGEKRRHGCPFLLFSAR